MDYESTLIQMLGLKEQRVTGNYIALLDSKDNRVGSIREQWNGRKCHWNSIEIKKDNMHFYTTNDIKEKSPTSFVYNFDVFYDLYKSTLRITTGSNPSIHVKNKHFGDMEFDITKDRLSFIFTTINDMVKYREKFDLNLANNSRIYAYEVYFCNKDKPENINKNRYKITACDYIPRTKTIGVVDWYKEDGSDLRIYDEYSNKTLINFIKSNDMAMSTLNVIKDIIESLWSGRGNLFDLILENPNMSSELKELLENDKVLGSVKTK